MSVWACTCAMLLRTLSPAVGVRRWLCLSGTPILRCTATVTATPVPVPSQDCLNP
ncbi:hypothetical protein FBU59_005962 [Linderina macrospora]|uniref:Uncharacterized protein n=1 Tax=Linderina macrospora TaxID=4868 RepID=A0ACC1J174_9FUNG|nr:hypothetical protein FBU59_005962 [Linderina macrospora]